MNRAMLLADGWTEVRPNPSPVTLLVPGIVVLGGATAAGYLYWQSIRREADESVVETPAGLRTTGIPGVYMKSGVNLTPVMVKFLPKLRALLNFDITVTSGFRTPLEQADAMVHNWQAHGGSNGGLEYLQSLYGREGPRFHPLMPDRTAVAGEVERVLSEGKWQQGHLAGKGLDFRVSNLSPEQIAALRQAGARLGAHVIDEGDHIHMDRFEGLLVEVPQAAQRVLPIAIAASAGLSVVALVGLAAYMRRQRRLATRSS